MKKIMILVAAIASAIACNAASVAWGSGAVYKATDPTTKIGKNVTDYTVTVAFFTDSAGTTAATGLTGDLSVSTSGNGSKFTGTVDGFDGATTYYTQIVITTAGYEAKSEIVAFTTPGTGASALDYSDGTGFNGGWTGFSTANAGAWQPAAVPEPTSGLLMLLGLAGLALKRKRA